ncbi:MAG: rhomboid family intramembrane serine protease [Flavobacterium lindanitolerans]|jgi:membrane associated rhomboid family serine protease|uniref:rhomboid family intramembrane serine protease n=1 Tax=Flavobacterium TaxID=237 RepID=UPI0006F383F7|nr:MULTISPECIES: rhomboid family intramembrane serine protease [Flavobacterium]KQS47862.1 protease [Flavobacterium sp. Leaf359]MBL7868544.1 rhomboid family intramembrane serine protease [Flavobacterium lindanitolerans]PZQ90229.1 MAG: rhomboid family intramembrane serine protease [Flavobacterium johnsoniae]THD33641.1 MAG: rhomboid family intramembrane serine protease [Flavobacterium johnsoniae]
MNIFLIVIIALNLIVSFKGFNDLSFFRKYEFHVGSIRAGEQIRMFSSGFLHVDIAHLAFNMLTLYLFAPYVIAGLGSFTFLMIYAGSLILGNLLTMALHKNDYSYRAVGASGAVIGVVYAAILVQPALEIYFMPGYIFGIIYLLYSIYGMKSKSDNIGHTAHFGGAIGGYIITLSRAPVIISENTFTVIILAVPIVILFIMAKTGKL